MSSTPSKSPGCLTWLVGIMAVGAVIWLVSWTWPVLVAGAVIAGAIALTRSVGVSSRAWMIVAGACGLVGVIGIVGQTRWMQSRNATSTATVAAGPTTLPPIARAVPESIRTTSTTRPARVTRLPDAPPPPPTTEAPTTTNPPPPPTTLFVPPPPPTTVYVPPPPPVVVTQPPTTLAATGGGCHPSYVPCVPVASDVDCAGGSGNGPAYVSGPVQVIGPDVYGLDGNDNDGVGCES